MIEAGKVFFFRPPSFKALLLLIRNSVMHTFMLYIISDSYPWNYFSVRLTDRVLHSTPVVCHRPRFAFGLGFCLSFQMISKLNTVQMGFIRDSSPLSLFSMHSLISIQTENACFEWVSHNKGDEWHGMSVVSTVASQQGKPRDFLCGVYQCLRGFYQGTWFSTHSPWAA